MRRMLTAATLAPSCSNKQPWRFVVAQSRDALDKVHRQLSGGNYWAKHAPAIVLVITHPELDCQVSDDRQYAEFDTGMAVMGLLAQAEAEGLFAHPMAGFDAAKLREEFGITDGYRLVTIVAVGYPGDESVLNRKHRELEHSERSRKALEEVVHFEKWAP